jgi:hypothetical protein
VGFAIQPALKEKSQVAKPPVLFHKADLGSGREVPGSVRDELADSGRKVVGLVHNAVDAQLSGSDQVDFDWTLEVLSQVSSYLSGDNQDGCQRQSGWMTPGSAAGWA